MPNPPCNIKKRLVAFDSAGGASLAGAREAVGEALVVLVGGVLEETAVVISG